MGKGSPAPAPDYSMQMQQAKFDREDKQAADAKTKADADAAAAKLAFAGAPATPDAPATIGNLDRAVNAARTAAQGTLASRHLSAEEFNPLIEQELTRVRGSVPDLAANPGSYFAPDLADTVLNKEQENRRTNYGNTVNQTFTPQYGQSQWADTADDPFIDTILGEGSGQAQQAIDRAKARGQLDDTGYSAAERKLGQATTTGRAQAQTLGGTVLARNRQALDDIGNQARSGASSYTLGGNAFDPSTYSKQATDLYGQQKGTFEGDVRGAIGDPSKFYDVGDIIGFGAKEQGAQNTGSSPLAEVLAKRETDRTARRGLGGTGTF